MLNCTETSQAKKTKGIAVTYRASEGEMYGTCPDTCSLKPIVTGTNEIDRDYEYAVRRAVPRKGQAFLYTHFHPDQWGEPNGPGTTVFNYSADSLESAAYHTAMGVASVAVVPVDYWEDKPSDKVTMVTLDPDRNVGLSIHLGMERLTNSWRSIRYRGVRCPNETTGIDCRNCGKGKPLCARFDRDYFVVFTAHGAAKRLAGDPDVKGGCYAGGGNVAMHWRGLSQREQSDETDGEKVTRFAAGLAPHSILRHHVAGDVGKAALTVRLLLTQMRNNLLQMSKKELVKEFVDDHYKHFGYYPAEVETSDGVFNWDEYWKLYEESDNAN
jgi:hypothetical protein